MAHTQSPSLAFSGSCQPWLARCQLASAVRPTITALAGSRLRKRRSPFYARPPTRARSCCRCSPRLRATKRRTAVRHTCCCTQGARSNHPVILASGSSAVLSPYCPYSVRTIVVPAGLSQLDTYMPVRSILTCACRRPALHAWLHAVTTPGYFWRDPGNGASLAGTTCPADHFCTGRVPASGAQAPTLCTSAYVGSEISSLQSPARSDEQTDCGGCAC